MLLAVALGVSWLLRHRNIRSFWPYITAGGALLTAGAALFFGGLHPALALVPIVPFLPRARRDPGLFVGGAPAAHDALNEFERWWKYPVQAIMFFSVW